MNLLPGPPLSVYFILLVLCLIYSVCNATVSVIREKENQKDFGRGNHSRLSSP